MMGRSGSLAIIVTTLSDVHPAKTFFSTVMMKAACFVVQHALSSKQ
jgi:hypothetical protein